MKTCKLYLPVVRTLENTKIIDFNQADYTWYCVCCLFLGSQFRLVNYFDSEIVRSLSAYYGKTLLIGSHLVMYLSCVLVSGLMLNSLWSAIIDLFRVVARCSY